MAIGGVALGAVGAILIEPMVIGLGVAATGVGAVMRFNDQRDASEKELCSHKE